MRREAEQAILREDIQDSEREALTNWLSGQPNKKESTKRVMIIFGWCVLFFIIIPVIIYLLSYIPYMAYNSRRIKSIGDFIYEVWKSQLGMLSYHSTKNLGMDHPFYSPWWEWPVIGKPMYYAAEQYLPENSRLHHSIFCFGNPVIWFGGLAAIVSCAVRAICGKRYIISGSRGIWHLKARTYDPRYMFVFTGIMAQYLPWVLVPRGTYIYHYFASLPFLMLILSLCFDGQGKKDCRRRFAIGAVITGFTVVAIIVFFPYASGISVPATWLDLGKRILKIWY
jgi:dolichyl-phosphate-mannose--protein O-mannosyl transferase